MTAQTNVERVLTAIKAILSILSITDQVFVMSSLGIDHPRIPSMRGSAVYNETLKIIRDKGTQFTTKELREELSLRGIHFEYKQLYNILGYLTRNRRIIRVEYGKYIIPDDRKRPA